MRAQQIAILAVLASALGAMPARAQDAPQFVVTPFVGGGTEGASPFGASITFPLFSRINLEAEVSYRRAEGSRHAPGTSASLVYSLPGIGRFTPFTAVGVGLSTYGEPAFFRPLGSDELRLGTRSLLAMTVNAGGGVTTRLTDRLSLRNDARWFRFAGQGRDQFRLSTGVSLDFGKR